jgi:hypothetical protein
MNHFPQPDEFFGATARVAQKILPRRTIFALKGQKNV